MVRRVLLLAVGVVACGSEDASEPLATTFSAVETASILSFLNSPEATVEVLDLEVGLDGRAARNIVAHVRGPDARLGTHDDDLLDSLEELDAIPYVGDAAIRLLDAYVTARAPQGEVVVVEGVTFSAEEAQAVLRLVNTAVAEVLDDGVGLDTRAVNAIIAARPISDLNALAAVPYVGKTALERLRAYAQPGATENPFIRHFAIGNPTRNEVAASWEVDNADECFLGVTEMGGRSGAPVLSQGPLPAWNALTFAWPDSWMDELLVSLHCTGNSQTVFDQWAVRRSTLPRPGPVAVDCSTLTGGSFDGVSFSAEEECTALQFLNEARFSDMAAMTDIGRRTAYDCTPDGRCDPANGRASQWASLRQFSDFTGIGRTTMQGLSTAIGSWTPGGPSSDTVADLWQNRASMTDVPIHIDRAFMTRRIADQMSQPDCRAPYCFIYVCAEVRDAPDAPNYLSACLRGIGADSAPECNAHPDTCLDPFVGSTVALRGTLQYAREAPGGYRISLVASGPFPAAE